MRRVRVETARGAASALVWDAAGAAAPWLHFAHATGMHAALYARLLAPLAARFNILAVDAWGHGADGRGFEGAVMEWEGLAGDALAVMGVVAPRAAWWLAGHSLGATCALMASVMAPERVAGVVMLDPPFMPFDVARGLVAAGALPENPLADQAARRRGVFGSRAEAAASYAGRGVFRQFSDADLADYVESGFVDCAGGVRLACAPEVEAACFRGVTLRMEGVLAAMARPFVLLAGETGSTVPEAEFAAFAAHPMCRRAERVPGTGHFLPLQAPDVVRAAIVSLCEG